MFNPNSPKAQQPKTIGFIFYFIYTTINYVCYRDLDISLESRKKKGVKHKLTLSELTRLRQQHF